MSRPRLTFIAGANGSGKTTLTRWNSPVFREIPLLDPDAIANTLQATTSTLRPVAAARQVLSSAAEHLKNAESFAVETTLAGKNYWPESGVGSWRAATTFQSKMSGDATYAARKIFRSQYNAQISPFYSTTPLLMLTG